MRIKAVTIRVIMPPGQKSSKRVFRAPDGQLFAPAGVSRVINACECELTKMFPEWKFKLVQVDEADFNFVYDGLRGLPSGADLDVDAEEKRIAEATRG